jgi:chemotaxis protein MotA
MIFIELHPRILETRLKSFLAPSERKGRLVSLKRIREKFNLKVDSGTSSPQPK